MGDPIQRSDLTVNDGLAKMLADDLERSGWDVTFSRVVTPGRRDPDASAPPADQTYVLVHGLRGDHCVNCTFGPAESDSLIGLVNVHFAARPEEMTAEEWAGSATHASHSRSFLKLPLRATDQNRPPIDLVSLAASAPEAAITAWLARRPSPLH